MYGCIEIATGKAILFIPHFPSEYTIWFGEIRVPEHYLKDYCVHEVYLEHDIATYFNDNKHQTIYRLSGLNSDSKTTHPVANHEKLAGLDLNFEDTKLWNSFVECRVIKSEDEMNLMRYATKASSNAHKSVMSKIKPGWMEYQAEALFQYECYDKAGMRNVAYTCISAAGPSAAVLHYGHAGEPNDKKCKDGDMVLFDMGGEYYCYASDITCSYPVNGKFNDQQRLIYTAVYNAWKAVIDQSKNGVDWSDMHRLAEKEILKVLKSGGLISGDLDDMMNNRLGAVFMPHGLGHLIGLDVHDVGGYGDNTPKRSTLPGLRSLRTARILETGMAITVEPGCYFVWSVIEELIKNNSPLAEFFVLDQLTQFKDFGGIRIESDCLVHENHMEDMCDVPRTIEEIENFMAESRQKEAEEEQLLRKSTNKSSGPHGDSEEPLN